MALVQWCSRFAPFFSVGWEGLEGLSGTEWLIGSFARICELRFNSAIKAKNLKARDSSKYLIEFVISEEEAMEEDDT